MRAAVLLSLSHSHAHAIARATPRAIACSSSLLSLLTHAHAIVTIVIIATSRAARQVGQLLGSTLGACLLAVVFPCSQDLTTNLGSNIVNPAYGPFRALVGEALGTLLLCYVVYETAVSPMASIGQNACIAIGFAVFLAHLLLLPITGCSINPTRSFGPALVATLRGCDNFTTGGLRDLWVMWLGPLLGAAAAAALQKRFVPQQKRSAAIADARPAKVDQSATV